MTRAGHIAVVCLLTVIVALAGCRTASPLAPKAQVDGLLSDIGVNCGEATQLGTFGGHRDGIRRLDSQTVGSARSLIRIMRSDPQATYLGLTMRRVVDTAAKATRECHLSHSSSLLSRSLG